MTSPGPGPRTVRIGRHAVGPGAAEVFLVAEVGNAHDGNLNFAHAFIDAVARTGAHAVKFQTHVADAESTPREPFRKRFGHLDSTRMDYWRRMEFTAEQWAGLKRHADDAGLIFLSSPFSPRAFELLDRLGIAAWKVASGEANNTPLVELMLRTGKPLLISTGMSYRAEIRECAGLCARRGVPYVLFHCTSSYPCPPEETGLNVIAELAREFECPVGLSDHSGEVYAPLAAAALGASAIEAHVCLSRDSFGIDVGASLTPAEIRKLADGLQSIRRMLLHPVDKDEAARKLEPMRRLFCKSIVFERDLPAGAVIGPQDLAGKKPGDGVPIGRVAEFYGLKLKRAVARDEALSPEQFHD